MKFFVAMLLFSLVNTATAEDVRVLKQKADIKLDAEECLKNLVPSYGGNNEIIGYSLCNGSFEPKGEWINISDNTFDAEQPLVLPNGLKVTVRAFPAGGVYNFALNDRLLSKDDFASAVRTAFKLLPSIAIYAPYFEVQKKEGAAPLAAPKHVLTVKTEYVVKFDADACLKRAVSSEGPGFTILGYHSCGELFPIKSDWKFITTDKFDANIPSLVVNGVTVKLRASPRGWYNLSVDKLLPRAEFDKVVREVFGKIPQAVVTAPYWE